MIHHMTFNFTVIVLEISKFSLTIKYSQAIRIFHSEPLLSKFIESKAHLIQHIVIFVFLSFSIFLCLPFFAHSQSVLERSLCLCIYINDASHCHTAIRRNNNKYIELRYSVTGTRVYSQPVTHLVTQKTQAALHHFAHLFFFFSL